MRLRDSLSGQEVELQAGEDGVIGMYVCGPTVYNRIHVGNARPFVVFQLFKRYLEWRGQPVRLVENITDINDKIYAAARQRGVASDRLAAEMAAAYIADTDRLGLGRPDLEPLATESIAEIVELIGRLIENGHAYEAEGDVYFAVRSFPEYGKLSNQDPDQLIEGARVEPGEHKRDALDFVLWKANKPDEDTAWDSPWGRGRPGWHIECSAMAERNLGPEFALHGGGRDLIFPHHENEVAQSHAAGRRFALAWVHNGMLQLSGEKMSKSLGNIEPLHAALDRWGAQTFLLYMLRGHYSAPIDYTDDALEQAQAAAETLRNRLRDGTGGEDAALRERIWQALDDDFNTPRALAHLFDAPPEASGTVAEVLDVLGLGVLGREDEAPVELVEKARRRDEARQARDFATADALRDEIEQAGWEARDTAAGTALYRRHGAG
jgi:cysteinyl-tRNA synthetase